MTSRKSRLLYIPNGRPKVLYMKPFRKDAWDLVVSNDLPRECEFAAHSSADAVSPASKKEGLKGRCELPIPDSQADRAKEYSTVSPAEKAESRWEFENTMAFCTHCEESALAVSIEML